MARQLPIAAAVLVFSIGLCASAFSQSPPTGQIHLPANCDGSPSANASARDVAALESDLARIARGDTDAMITLGYAYFAGQGLKRDVDCTIQLWQIAANAGNVGAMYALGSSYYGVVNFPTNYRLALEWSEKAAAGGKRHAAFLVAEIYDAGKGTEPDPNLACEWYERVWNWPGAPKDDHLAGLVTEAFGRLYLNGRGVPQDDALAVQWWQRSADAGNRAAMGELARMYREGRGVKKSEQLAQFWSDRSAEENLPDCEASKLESNLSLHRNSNSGDVVATVEVKNLSAQTCRVMDAQPSAAFSQPQKTVSIKTCRNCSAQGHAGIPHVAVLPPGGYAHMGVQWKDSPRATGAPCVSMPSMVVRLYFRDAHPSTAADIAFSIPRPQVCSSLDFTSLIPGPDPYLSGTDPATFDKLRVAMSETAYYPEEQIFVDVTVPTSEPLAVGKRCPKLFLNERDPAGNNMYWEKGGETDWQCTITAAEPGAMTFRIHLWGSSNSIIGEHSLQFFQYTSTGAEKDAWRLLAQSDTFQYRVGDPKKMVRTWGPEVNGLALSIGVDKTTYVVGETIPLHVAFWNIRATKATTLDPCKQAELTVLNANGEKFDQVDGDLSCNYSGPCGPSLLAPGATATSEQNLTDYHLPAGTYTVTAEWRTVEYLKDPKETPCFGPVGTQVFHVDSSPVTIRIIAPKQPSSSGAAPT